jgi:tetratricopeptide (TPR) repeat protein
VILFYLGLLALAEDRYVEAQQHLQESVAVFRDSGQQSDVGWPLAALGGAESRLGQLDQAQAHLCEALQGAAEVKSALNIRIVLPCAALLLAGLGQAEQAVEVYALALRFPFVANSHMCQDGVGKHIAAAAAALPPDVVAAAQERGRARDLWATVEELLVELGPRYGLRAAWPDSASSA